MRFILGFIGAVFAAVLLLMSRSFDLDARRLDKAGVREVPLWRARVETATDAVVLGGTRLPIRAFVVTDPMAGLSVDGSKRHLWSMAAGDTDGFVDTLERSTERIHRVDNEVAASIILGALR